MEGVLMRTNKELPARARQEAGKTLPYLYPLPGLKIKNPTTKVTKSKKKKKKQKKAKVKPQADVEPKSSPKIAPTAARADNAVNDLADAIPDSVWEQHKEDIIEQKLCTTHLAIKYIDTLRNTVTKSGHDFPEICCLNRSSRRMLSKQILLDMVPLSCIPRYVQGLDKVDTLTTIACEGAREYIIMLKEGKEWSELEATAQDELTRNKHQCAGSNMEEDKPDSPIEELDGDVRMQDPDPLLVAKLGTLYELPAMKKPGLNDPADVIVVAEERLIELEVAKRIILDNLQQVKLMAGDQVVRERVDEVKEESDNDGIPERWFDAVDTAL